MNSYTGGLPRPPDLRRPADRQPVALAEGAVEPSLVDVGLTLVLEERTDVAVRGEERLHLGPERLLLGRQERSHDARLTRRLGLRLLFSGHPHGVALLDEGPRAFLEVGVVPVHAQQRPAVLEWRCV